MKLRSPHYRAGVKWIAYNDDAAETSIDVIVSQLTVIMLADIFGVEAEDVANDVIRFRETIEW